MDATRRRRTRDTARRRWYAFWRCQRFARHLGFNRPAPDEPVVSAEGAAPCPALAPAGESWPAFFLDDELAV